MGKSPDGLDAGSRPAGLVRNDDILRQATPAQGEITAKRLKYLFALLGMTWYDFGC